MFPPALLRRFINEQCPSKKVGKEKCEDSVIMHSILNPNLNANHLKSVCSPRSAVCKCQTPFSFNVWLIHVFKLLTILLLCIWCSYDLFTHLWLFHLFSPRDSENHFMRHFGNCSVNGYVLFLFCFFTSGFFKVMTPVVWWWVLLFSSLIKLQRLSFVVLFARATILFFHSAKTMRLRRKLVCYHDWKWCLVPDVFCIATYINFVKYLSICPPESRAHLLQTIFASVVLETQSILFFLR